ncbi:MAG: hypothetical protein AAFR75_04085 [Pseudomonadota bacterium]
MTILDGIMLFLFVVIFGGAFASLMGFRPNFRRWNSQERSGDGGFMGWTSGRSRQDNRVGADSSGGDCGGGGAGGGD